MEEKKDLKTDFIREIIRDDIRTGKNGGAVVTRFPPEPNGYLHIGHAKSICLNFGIARDFGGRCHLRLDDTNPAKEETEYIESIKEDVAWLGFDWGQHLYYASDYYDRIYGYAVELIQKGKAYVCNLTPDQVREYRGTAVDGYSVRASHVEAAKMLAEKGWKLTTGDKVGFVILKGKGRLYSRVKPYVFATLEEVDPEYYITNQVVPAATRVLEFFGVSEKELLNVEAKHEEAKSLLDFMKK
jgi:hypothetical protein